MDLSSIETNGVVQITQPNIIEDMQAFFLNYQGTDRKRDETQALFVHGRPS